MEKILVADVMSKELISIGKDASIRDAAKLMVEKKISSMVIKDHDKIAGIITERDFVKMASLDSQPKKVSDVMSKDLITIDAEENVLEAVRLMGKHRIRHLLVKKGGQPTAIVSLRDVLKVEPDAIYGYLSQKG